MLEAGRLDPGLAGRLPRRLWVESFLASPGLWRLVIPWLVDTSLQSLPVTHHLLPRVWDSGSSLLTRTVVALG